MLITTYTATLSYTPSFRFIPYWSNFDLVIKKTTHGPTSRVFMYGPRDDLSSKPNQSLYATWRIRIEKEINVVWVLIPS